MEGYIEKVFHLADTDSKTIEKVIDDENIHYMHFIFNKGEGAQPHYTNGNVYMTVIRGTLSIALGDQEMKVYGRGSIIKIPYRTKMVITNRNDDLLEITVVKAPAPKEPPVMV